jgi:aminopeptidase
MKVGKEVKKLANTLVNHSISLKKGELVKISFYGPGKPLVNELTKIISKKGGFPLVILSNENHIKYAPLNILKKEFPLGKEISRRINASITIDDRSDIYHLRNVDNTRINTYALANQENKWHVINKKKWCLVRYPTNAFAQQAELCYGDYSKYAFKTMNVDWNKKKKEMTRLKKLMDNTDKIRITGEKTDLKFSIKNRNSVICYGKYNMPDGEVFTAPVKETVNGRLFVPVAFYDSKKFEDVELRFKKGRVINYSVKNNIKEFRKIINADANAKSLGELGIGTNTNIKRIVGDILFDEKKGGTIHLALGSAFQENFKQDFTRMKPDKKKKLTNASAVHWDLIIKPKTINFDGKEAKI